MKKETKNLLKEYAIILVVFIIVLTLFVGVAYWADPEIDYQCLKKIGTGFCNNQNMTYSEISTLNSDFRCVKDNEREYTSQGYSFLKEEKQSCCLKPARTFKRGICTYP